VPMVLQCQNVEDEPRVAVQFKAMTTAWNKALGRSWVDIEVWLEVVNVIVGMWEWMVATMSVGWGSSDGGPRRLRRCLCSMILLRIIGFRWRRLS